MKKYIDAEKLIANLRLQKRELELSIQSQGDYGQSCHIIAYENILSLITSLQQEQPNNMIQWTGNNLKEVIDFTGKSPRFGEWFKSWEEYETYVHTHNDILKLFCEDGSHYEVPVGAWIAKTPDGYNVLSVAKYIQQEQPEAQNGKFVFPKYLYARTKDNKTIDMSYAPQDMTAVEYVRNNFVEQESEVDLEKEIDDWYNTVGIPITADALKETARHFAEWGAIHLNSRKEE